MAIAVLEMRMPSNWAKGGRPRVLRLLADVRATWVDEHARVATNRRESAEMLAEAVIRLVSIPGQRTVAVFEDGITVAEGVAALRSMNYKAPTAA
jgi:hypothetical protein